MSIREKTLLKRRVNREHNSNFRAGYVHINEEYLHKTGVRGKKSYIIWIVVCLVLLAAIVNLLITITIFGVLKLDYRGMRSVELVPEDKTIRFHGMSDMGKVYLTQNTISGFSDEDLVLNGMNENPIYLNVKNPNHSSVKVDARSTTLTSKDGFVVLDPASGKQVFSSQQLEQIDISEGVENLHTKVVHTNKVTNDENLLIQSDQDVSLRGSEGIKLLSKELSISAKEDVRLKTGKALELDARDGIILEQVKKPEPSEPVASVLAYKLCAMKSTGRLFLVPGDSSCLVV